MELIGRQEIANGAGVIFLQFDDGMGVMGTVCRCNVILRRVVVQNRVHQVHSYGDIQDHQQGEEVSGVRCC